MNERIKKLRLALNLNQTEFGLRIGVKQTTVAGYENGSRAPIDAIITSICREFGVSEEWLRTGAGGDDAMFIKVSKDEEMDFILGQISGSQDETIKRFIRAYWNLEENEKAVIRKLIDSLSKQ